jgi:hypothetical protein
MSKKYKIFDNAGKETTEVVCDKLSVLSEFNFKNDQNYFLIQNNEMFGIIDTKGKFLLDCIYQRVSLINVKEEVSYFSVKQDGLFGIIDSNGDTILDIKYSDIFKQDDVYRIKINDLYGFLDFNFNTIVEPCFTNVGLFSSNLCYVKSESFNGFINKKGEKILDSTPFKFCEKFYGQLASFDGIIENLGKHSGFINIQGNIIVEPKYYMVYDFQENLIIVSKRNGFINLLNQDGVEILEDIYSSDVKIYFNDKLAKVKKKTKYGFIDSNGNEVIKCKYSGVEDFRCSISVFKEKKLFGCINREGEVIFSPKYDKINGFSNSISLENSNSYNSSYDSAIKNSFMNQEFSNTDARSIVSIGSSFGLIDTNGFEVVPLIFDDFDYYPKENTFKVKKRNDYGFVDIYGKEIITPQYKMARNFSNGLAAIKNNDKWGFINKSGEEIIKCNYSNCSDFIGNGFAYVEL